MKTVLSFASLAVALACSRAVAAESFQLEMDKLPSAQGWQYVALGDGAAAAETAIYTVGNGLLHQNSLGVGMTQGGGNWYAHAVALAPTDSWSMTLVGRLLSFESIATPAYPFGFCFGANDDSAVGFGSDNLQYVLSGAVASAPLPAGFDASAFNTYQYTATPGLQSFSINGFAVFTNQVRPAGNPGAILFGDGTGYANAQADIQSFSFTSSVPEPGTGVLLMAGLGVVGRIWRRRGASASQRRASMRAPWPPHPSVRSAPPRASARSAASRASRSARGC